MMREIIEKTEFKERSGFRLLTFALCSRRHYAEVA